jgi:cobaltochelatase CobN
VIVTTSGLFRDLYPNLLNQIDRAGRLALAASAGLIRAAPRARPALDAALAPLGSSGPRHQPLADNIAAAWLARTRQLGQPGLASPTPAARRPCASSATPRGLQRRRQSPGRTLRRLARAQELGRVLNRMGHAYGLDASGDAAHQAFETALAGVARSYHGRASNLYGLLDNNDAFDYLGGMSVGIETLTGRRRKA